MKTHLVFITIFITSFTYSSLTLAQDDKDLTNDRKGDRVTNSSESNPGTLFISFYKEYISPVDGDKCPSLPSCSEYSLRALKKHGFVMGWLMTVDRLLHEGKEEAQTSPLVYADDRWKIYDPVENNDFWWFPKKKKDKANDE